MNDYDKRKLQEFGEAKLYYLIGLPRSGKSTLSKRWAAKKPGRIVLSRDDFRFAVYGEGWNEEREPEAKVIFKAAVNALRLQNIEIMIDETSINKKERDYWDDLGGIPIYVSTPLEVCLSRIPDGDESIVRFKEAVATRINEELTKDPLPVNMVMAEDFFKEN